MGKEADGYVKDGLSLTKRLHKEIAESSLSSDDAKRLKSMAAEANKLLVNLRRQLVDDANSNSVREAILKQVMKEELIDRDANAARISDRQRLASERVHGIASLAQRSEDAVQQINASIVSLCPWQIGLSPSVPMIAAARATHT